MMQESVDLMHRLVRRRDMVIVMSPNTPARRQRKNFRRPGFASRLFLRARSVLDGLGRLGIAPWELFQLAAYAAEFLRHRMAALWRAKDPCPGDVRILWILRVTEIEVVAMQPGTVESRPVPYVLPGVQESRHAALLGKRDFTSA